MFLFLYESAESCAFLVLALRIESLGIPVIRATSNGYPCSLTNGSKNVEPSSFVAVLKCAMITTLLTSRSFLGKRRSLVKRS